MTHEEYNRVIPIVAELRAMELVLALRHAVSGASHWRSEAKNLLALIYGGVPPQRYEPPQHTQDAA